MNRPSNIIPLTPAHIGSRRTRIVRPAPPELHRHVADLDEWLDRRRREHNRERLQKIVTVAALVVAWFCILFFSFQAGRGAL